MRQTTVGSIRHFELKNRIVALSCRIDLIFRIEESHVHEHFDKNLFSPTVDTLRQYYVQQSQQILLFLLLLEIIKLEIVFIEFYLPEKYCPCKKGAYGGVDLFTLQRNERNKYILLLWTKSETFYCFHPFHFARSISLCHSSKHYIGLFQINVPQRSLNGEF